MKLNKLTEEEFEEEYKKLDPWQKTIFRKIRLHKMQLEDMAMFWLNDWPELSSILLVIIGCIYAEPQLNAISKLWNHIIPLSEQLAEEADNSWFAITRDEESDGPVN